MNMVGVIVLASAIWTTGLAHAETTFHAPQEITHEGEHYKLASQSTAQNGMGTFEYTTNNESVKAWSKLVTLNYMPKMTRTPLEWLQATTAALRRQTPVPHFNMYILKEHGYARIIYEPTARFPQFESNVQKSFHQPACAGLVVYQYAVKYPPLAEGADKKETLLKIAEDNKQAADAMDNNGWQPDCS